MKLHVVHQYRISKIVTIIVAYAINNLIFNSYIINMINTVFNH